MADEENWFDNTAALEKLWVNAQRAVAVVAETTLGQAQRNAPVKEGTLRGSGTVLAHGERPLPIGVATITETVAFTIEYAAIQEADEDYQHPLGGEAHFLGNSLKAHANDLTTALAKLGLR